MALDLAQYQHQPLNHPNRSYQFLMASMERRVMDNQMKRNRANDEAAIRSGNVSGFGQVAAPAPGTTNPPGKKA
eukprot:7941332-Heterocapsa_arctica.AAC.1